MKRFYFFLIFFISSHLFLSAQSTEVGSTPGELSVSLSGAANYTIPIAVPPGINGIVPQINIVYSSQSGNGVAGYGWNIGGLSSIGRIASTKFHDGIIDPVDFDNLDRFAFNGQRLLVKNGTAGVYGANNTIYETENFSNVKITSFGVHPNGANYGPAYFLVEYPDGSKAYYGNSSDSRSLTDWAITYWESAQGVRITYNYTQSNNVLDIASIKYGTLTTTAPINEIKFNYDARLRPEQAYIGGQSFTKSNKLLSINVVGNGIGYRNYYFNYKTTSVNYQQLDYITEKSGDLSKSYNSTSFTYYTGSETIVPKASTSQTALGNINSLNSAVVSGDFDGDAKMDFVLYPKTGINGNKDFWLFTNVGKNSLTVPSKVSCGYFSAIFASTGLTSNNKQYHSQGVTIAQVDSGSDAVNFITYNNMSQGMTSDQLKKAYFPERWISDCYSSMNQSQAKLYFSGDFNGDGLTDVIALDQDVQELVCQPDRYGGPDELIYSTNTTGQMYFVDLDRRKTVNFVNFAGTLQESFLSNDSKIETFDVNGDGKTDILHFKNGKVYVYDLDNNNQLRLLWQTPDLDIKISQSILPGDYNGDGKMDFIITKSFGTYATDYIKYLSKGDGFVKIPQTYAFANMGTSEDTQAIYTCDLIPLDIDADGKTDIVQFRSIYGKSLNTGGAMVNVFKNSNSSFTATAIPTYQTTPSTTFKSYPIPVFLSPKTNNQYLSVGVISDNQMYTFDSQDDFSQKGLLKTVIDGNGVTQTITYSPLVQDPYEPFYTPTIFTETFPNIDIVAAPNFKIVTKLEQQSVGQYKKQIFMYLGAVSNTEGIGFLGFRSTVRTNWYADDSKMISNISKFDISQRGANIENYSVLGYHDPLFPTANQISRIITKENYTVATSDNLVATQRIILKENTVIQSGSTFSAKIVEESNNSTNAPSDFITKSVLTYESNLMPNKVFKLQNTVVNQFNKLEGTSNETINTYDDYNNVTNAKILAKEGSTVVQTSTSDIVYQSPTQSPYILGRPSSKTENVSVNGDSMTNKEVYTYNGNQLLTTIEKSGNGTSTITEKNDYDNFGNITKKTITVPGLTPRITSYEYDLSGRFLTKNIDVEGLFKTFDYNLSSGVLNSETNQNRLTTTYEYDKWFKKTKTIDYLGKSNSYVYTRSSEKSIVTNNGDDNSSIEETFDDLGRKIKTKIKDVAGNFSSVDYLYDIYDRNYKISEPYFGSSASQFNETQYDNYGRPIKSISFTGKTVDYTYSGLTTTISENSKTKISVKNAAGNIISMTDSPGGTVTYKYFANGKLKESDFGGVKTTITQDGWGRKTKLVDSSAGTYSYEYNDFGEITKETTPNGTTSYLLDEVGKLKEKTIVGGSVNNSKTTYAYDGTTKLLLGTTFEDFLNTNTITEVYSYDAYKRINKKVETTPYAVFTKDLTYDAFGRIYTETSTAQVGGESSSNKIRNTYNNGSHWQILDDVTGSVLWQTNTLNAKGNILTALNGPIKITNSYDNYNYVSEFKYDLASTPTTNVLTLGTVFDAQKGNLTSRTNTLFNRSESFKYDALDRLTEYTNSAGSQETQSYDDRGRITQNNVGVYNYSNTKPYQNTSIDVTPNALSYYTAKPTLNVTYNVFKSPVQIEDAGVDKVSFTYNDSNSRSAMFYGGLQDDKLQRQFKKYYAADGTIEVKQNNSGAIEFLFYIGGDGYSAPLVFKDNVASQNYLYLLRDYQGTITAIVNQTGAVVEKRLFDAWGDLIKVQDGAGNVLSGLTILDRGYTGHEHLQSVGIVHMNGRLYDPKLHRFLQPDNFVQDPFNTQNYNRYGYCWNNPLRYTDASGEWINIVIGAVIGGVVNWATHGCKFNAQGLGYFGVGAVAGGLTAMGAGGVSSALAGGSFSAGALGTSAALTATSSFFTGAVIGASGGLVGGFATGVGNGLVDGQNIGQALGNGVKDGLVGALTGGVIGGIAGGIDAVRDGRRFFDGATVVRQTAVPAYTLPNLLQSSDASCQATVGASIDQSLGGHLTEMDVRNLMPRYDYTGAGAGDVPFWREFAANTSRQVTGPIKTDYSSTIFTAFRDGTQNNVRIALSTSNHALALQSVTKVDIFKMSGRIITKYFYNVMDPAYGASKTISTSMVKNIFIIR